MGKWRISCLLFASLMVMTACSQLSDTEQETKKTFGSAEAETSTEAVRETVKSERIMETVEAAADTVTVSTVSELIKAIGPNVHIILKPGTYNFSSLTEKEIEECSGYVDGYGLNEGEFYIHNAPGLILEAEESETVRLITENGYVNVVTLSLCDGAVLKGLILGHEIEKGECNAYVLELSASQSVTVEECGLFGCGTYGISADDAAGLTVTDTEIYECTGGAFSLCRTTETVFDRCWFYDNDGMFAMWDGSEVLVRDTEIFRNRNGLLQGNSSGSDTAANHITFRNCTFRDNPDMDIWPNVVFENCDFPPTEASASASMIYEELIERFRRLAADPYEFSMADGEEELNFLMAAQGMGESWGYDPLDMLGYAMQDLNSDGVPELAIGPMPEYGAYLFTLFTLSDGEPQLVFGDESDGGYAYLTDGRFFYSGYYSASKTGQGFYHLADDGSALICDEFYFVDILDGDESNAVVYYNTTGSWDVEDSQETDIPMERFWEWEPEYAYLPMIPFSAGD